jgi:hypothetical protein
MVMNTRGYNYHVLNGANVGSTSEVRTVLILLTYAEIVR